MELREPVALILREKFKLLYSKNESIDAKHWGGAVRSNDEASVMDVE